jgi:hypothetical protein
VGLGKSARGDVEAMSASRILEDGTEQKLPYMQLWVADWMQDPCLRQCRLATQGAWFQFICDMHNNGQTGEARGTIERFARQRGCSGSEMQEVIDDLAATGTADVLVIANGQNGDGKNGKRLLPYGKTESSDDGKTEWQIDSKTVFVLRNRRMWRKHQKSLNISEIRSEIGRKGAEKRWKSDGKHMANPNGKNETASDGKGMANPLTLAMNSDSGSDFSVTGSGLRATPREEEPLDL